MCTTHLHRPPRTGAGLEETLVVQAGPVPQHHAYPRIESISYVSQGSRNHSIILGNTIRSSQECLVQPYFIMSVTSFGVRVWRPGSEVGRTVSVSEWCPCLATDDDWHRAC